MKNLETDNKTVWYKFCTKILGIAWLYKLFDTFAARVKD